MLGQICCRENAETSPRGALPHLRTLARRKCNLNTQTERARAELQLTFPHVLQYENGEPCNICGHTLARVQPAPAVNSVFPSEILPGFLYLGSYDNASRSELLKAQAITHILNVRMQVLCCMWLSGVKALYVLCRQCLLVKICTRTHLNITQHKQALQTMLNALAF